MTLYPALSAEPGPTAYPGAGVYAPAIPTVVIFASGSPRAEIVITDILDATRTMTLYRISGRRTQKVRSAINVYAVGGFAVVDYDVPFNTDVVYRAEMFDADGYSLGFTRDTSARLNRRRSAVHNVLQPEQGLDVRFQRGAASDLSRPTNATVEATEGSATGVYGGGYRTALTDVGLPFWTLTDQDADTAELLFGDPDDDYPIPAVLCIRIGSDEKIRLPKPFYAACTVTEKPFNLHAGGSAVLWDMTASEVRPPALALVVAGYTLGDLDDAFTTLGDVDDRYLTLLDVDRDFRLGGGGNGPTPPDPNNPDTPTDPDADLDYGAGEYGADEYGR